MISPTKAEFQNADHRAIEVNGKRSFGRPGLTIDTRVIAAFCAWLQSAYRQHDPTVVLEQQYITDKKHHLIVLAKGSFVFPEYPTTPFTVSYRELLMSAMTSGELSFDAPQPPPETYINGAGKDTFAWILSALSNGKSVTVEQTPGPQPIWSWSLPAAKLPQPDLRRK